MQNLESLYIYTCLHWYLFRIYLLSCKHQKPLKIVLISFQCYEPSYTDKNFSLPFTKILIVECAHSTIKNLAFLDQGRESLPPEVSKGASGFCSFHFEFSTDLPSVLMLCFLPCFGLWQRLSLPFFPKGGGSAMASRETDTPDWLRMAAALTGKLRKFWGSAAALTGRFIKFFPFPFFSLILFCSKADRFFPASFKRVFPILVGNLLSPDKAEANKPWLTRSSFVSLFMF